MPKTAEKAEAKAAKPKAAPKAKTRSLADVAKDLRALSLNDESPPDVRQVHHERDCGEKLIGLMGEAAKMVNCAGDAHIRARKRVTDFTRIVAPIRARLVSHPQSVFKGARKLAEFCEA